MTNKCLKCGKSAPEILQKQISHGFAWDTFEWYLDEQTNDVICPNCF